MGKINLHDKYFHLLEIYESDNEVVKIMADSMMISKGWDSLPDTHHTAAVVSYRENDIWYFERRRVYREMDDEDDVIEVTEELDDEYRAVRFPDASINEEMMAYAIIFVRHQNLVNRGDILMVDDTIEPLHIYLN